MVDDRRLTDVLLGNDESLELFLTGTDGNRQSTADGLQVSVEAQFTDEHVFVELFALYLAVSGQDGNGQRQVVAGALLFDVSWRQVDCDVSDTCFKTTISSGCFYAIIAFFYGRIRQSCHVELHTSSYVHLDCYLRGFQTVNCHRIRLCKHNKLVLSDKDNHFSLDLQKNDIINARI